MKRKSTLVDSVSAEPEVSAVDRKQQFPQSNGANSAVGKKLSIVNCALLIVFCLFFGGKAWGQSITMGVQNVTIGTGTSYGYYPMPGYYGWQYDVYLYTPSSVPELENACTIKSIAYNIYSNSTTTGAQMTIWVKDVDLTTLSSSSTFSDFTSGATQVYYNSSFSSTTGWNTLPFGTGSTSSSFNHQAGKALLVAVYGKGCSTSGGCSRQCYYTSVTGTHWHKHQDNSDPGTSVAGTGVDANRVNIQLGCVAPNITQTISCGSSYNFYDSGGSSSNYSTSENYTATFTCAGNITINFSSFATESSSGCYDWDWIKIYDGDESSGTLLVWGQTGCSSRTLSTGTDYTASSGTMTVKWKSDGSTVAAGWVATVTGVKLSPTLSFSGPTSVGIGNSIDCVATPSVGDATVTYTSSNTSIATVSPSGRVTGVAEGSVTITASISGDACANNTSATRTITVTPMVMANGLTKDIPCGTNYSFYDSGGASSDYGAGEDMTATFTSNGIINLSFSSFVTESCCDKLAIYDGDASGTVLLAQTGGSLSTTTFEATSGIMTVVWHSDGSVQKAGWAATISATSCVACRGDEDILMANELEKRIECGTSYCFFDEGGSDGNYSTANANHYATFTSDGDITLSFSSFTTESATYDYMYVYDGDATSGTILINKAGGSTIPSAVTATRGTMTVYWHTDGSVFNAGWAAKITANRCDDCHGDEQIIMANGLSKALRFNKTYCFYDEGGYANGYTTNSAAHYATFTSSGDITLSFSMFNTESGWDKLTVYDGTSSGTVILNAVSGTTIPNDVTAFSGTMTVLWQTDGSGLRPGWIASIIAEPHDPCRNITEMTCGQTYSGTLGTEGVWNDYNEQYNWNEPGEEVVFSFTPSVSGTYSFMGIGNAGDPDFFLMSSCGNTENITSWSDETDFEQELVAGTTYYLIVDNYSSDEEAEYEVSVSLSSISPVTASASSVCNGSAVTLTAPAGGSSYSWSVSGSGNSITPTVTANTTYRVTVWSGSSCSASSSVDVAVIEKVTPTFASATYCVGTSASFPTVTATDPVTGSTLTGSWTPSSISTASAGTTSYTFTAGAGQCANQGTHSVEVKAKANPTFASATYCVGTSASFPTVTATDPVTGSTLTGSWTPSTISTASAGTTSYTFTASAGQCANTGTHSVTVKAKANPTFADATYCVGTSASFPTVTATDPVTGSTLTGSWTPSTISTASAGTTSYTFTAGTGQCSNTGTHSVTVKAKANPTFADATYCVGTSASFPTVTATDPVTGSTLTGSWTPSSISTASAGTTSYTFTAGTGQCSNTGTHSVTVKAKANPTFADATYCVGTSASFPTVTATDPVTGSTLTGSWTPSSISTASAGTTSYTFTASAGQCSNTGTHSVTVKAKANPTFASATYCVGTSASFPTVTATDPVTGSTLTGSWTPSSISTASAGTTSYTFTAGTGQCSNTGTHSVTVKAKASPTFADATYCVGTSASFPTVTATDPVTGSTLTGSWTPSTISTASAGTTSYTFTAGTGQCSNTGTHSVTVNAPSVGTLSVSPQTICPGTSTTLTVTSTSPTASEGLAYAWPTGYGSSAETSSILAEGSYTVTVTATNIVNGKTCQTTGEKTGTVTYKKPSAGEISTMGLENGNLLWTGHSTDWSAENNWMQYSTAGGGTYTLASTPTNSSNVVIGSYSDCVSTPTLDIDATANAGTLKIASGTTVSGENVINMYGNLINNGTFDAPINFAGTTALSGSGTTTLRDVTISNRFDASSASMTISGNWTNNGTFNANGPVVFAGASAQTIGGSNATTFNNITFNNGNGISISKEPTINGTATFTSCIVTGDVTFGESASATVSDYTSYVDGTVTKTLGSSAFTFPTGSNGVLGSVTVPATRSGGTVSMHFNKSASADGFDVENDGYPRFWNINDMCAEDGTNRFHHVSNAEYWDISSTAAVSGVNFRSIAASDVHFTDTSINQRDVDAIKFAIYDGCWKNMGGTASVSGNYYELAVTGVTIPATNRAGLKGSFGSTDDATLLPIELTSFTATCDGRSALVEWSTASERNNDYFSLERSDDAINFTEVARVAGAGNSIEPIEYAYNDYGIHGGDNYYRLVQVDYDGTRTVSEVIVANCIEPESGGEPEVLAYPNPFSSELTVVLDNFGNRAATIEVYDMLGKLIYTNKVAAPQNSYETILNLSNLPSGAYTVRVSTNDFVINRNVVKQ